MPGEQAGHHYSCDVATARHQPGWSAGNGNASDKRQPDRPVALVLGRERTEAAEDQPFRVRPPSRHTPGKPVPDGRGPDRLRRVHATGSVESVGSARSGCRDRRYGLARGGTVAVETRDRAVRRHSGGLRHNPRSGGQAAGCRGTARQTEVLRVGFASGNGTERHYAIAGTNGLTRERVILQLAAEGLLARRRTRH